MLSRRRLLTTAAAVPPTAALVGTAAEAAQAAEAGSFAGKNVLIFITDQQRKTMHFPAGWEEKNLPGMTRLKKNGVSFENAFCNTAMCSPSRATLFTGLYPAQHGVKYTLEEDMPADQYPQVELSTELVNLASVMKAAGYDVVYKGKWHLSKPVGDDWSPEDLARYGFDRWSPPDGGSNQDIDEAGGGIVDHDGHYMNDDGDAADGTEGVLKFLTTRTEGDKPWCLVVALINPHDALFYPGPANMTPPKYVQAGYDDSWLVGDIGLPVTFNEDLSTKPKCQAQFAKLFGASGPLRNQQMMINYLNFYGNLLKLADQYLVDILDTLESTGQLDDTVVVRTADHGEMALAHTMRQKSFNAYEETIHMPMVFSNPVLYPKARKSEQLISHVDLLPTLAALVEAPASARSSDWQGIDYSAHVLGKAVKPTQDRVVFTFDDWQSGQSQGPYIPAPNHIVMVREKRWKLAKYYDESGKKPSEWEMYDLQRDPLERHNLAYKPAAMTPKQRAEFKRLRARIKEIEKRKLQPLPA
ncbi:sulfatase-like hydrolase/transferase [Nocardioides sp. CN2-186]|uniref:sulfatase-like hydrolase/transferase n=1 Tax=Nocardioides tweenelious TaxID=3156607 RepID=UPI0032B4B804